MKTKKNAIESIIYPSNIIPLHGYAGQLTVKAEDLHRYLMIKQPFPEWILCIIASDELFQGKDYTKNGHYRLTVECAKLLTISYARPSRAQSIIEYFDAKTLRYNEYLKECENLKNSEDINLLRLYSKDKDIQANLNIALERK